ncbi:hypothetical protein L227DRAFT_301456 [Lentinus tigrinus ALCF2SS1-6]|uniref:Uncharacterized protein n=1 Tax=Lentinus tigrinus ALCF2SS1-6 TaxID=1328759 RepID=A0A5C2RVX4_9APHY|nr:hypothetical protein L227DRAFT_301456 [Lentinus tigrinus ALCF2SS1-6]
MDLTQWPCLPGGCAGLSESAPALGSSEPLTNYDDVLYRCTKDYRGQWSQRVQARRKAQQRGGWKQKGRGCGEAAAVQAKGLNTLARRPSVPRRPQTRGIPRQPTPRTLLRHGASVPSTTPKSEVVWAGPSGLPHPVPLQHLCCLSTRLKRKLLLAAHTSSLYAHARTNFTAMPLCRSL